MAESVGTGVESGIGRKAALEVAFVVAWSSGFVGATLGTRFAGATTLLAWRYFLCAAVIFVLVIAFRRRWPGWREAGRQVVTGMFAQIMYLGCVFWAAGIGISGGITALIAALQPLVAVALAVPLLGEKAGVMKWVGLGIGFVGVVMVVGGDIVARADVPVWGYLLPVVAMLGLVAATLFERVTASDDTEEVSLDVALAIQFAVGAVFFGVLAVATGSLAPPDGASFWFAISWAALLSGLGGYGFYWINVRLTGVGRVSSLLYLTPPTTMIWSYFMFGDHIPVSALVGMVVCAAGVAVSARK